jgi:O-antigen ligase
LSYASKKSLRFSAQFAMLAIFLVIVFLTGGATRWDAQSLPVLRPLSVAFCAVAMLSLRLEHIRQNKILFVGFASIFALGILHLVPLPPAMWQAMPGRQELAEIDRFSGVGVLWRSLTVTPMNGAHAVLSLFAPLVVLLLGVQLTRDELYRLLPLIIALGCLSGLVGLLQIINGANSALYIYRITNHGLAVGLFANRNHGAVMLACLFPMLAVYASYAPSLAVDQRIRKLLSVGIAMALLPLILISGSRSGMAAAAIGIVGAMLLYTPLAPEVAKAQSKARSINWRFVILVGSALLCIGFLTYFFSRAEAISRLLRPEGAEAGRLEFWAVSLKAFWAYFPWGSGSGSFAEVYQRFEPDRLLSTNYLNRAHNDWLEMAVTFGLPGLALLAMSLIWFAIKTVQVWRFGERQKRSILYARLGSVTLLILVLASATDYPMRTPIIMCCAMIYCLWLTVGDRSRMISRDSQKGTLQR